MIPVRHRCGVAALVLGTVGCGSSPAGSGQPTAPQSSVDWPAVERALGAPLETQDRVHHVDIPRTDLHVSVGDIVLAPGMEIAAEANFLPTSGPQTLMIGELTVLDSEQPRVLDALQRGGLVVTAIHKHLPAATPDLWWIHVEGFGEATNEAAAFHAAVAATGTPLPPTQPQRDTLPGLDVAGVDAVLAAQGKSEGGAYQVHLPISTEVTDIHAGMELPPEMEASSLVMFQPVGNGQSVTSGDLAMTADQLDPTVSALRANGIQVVSIHNHLLYDQPRLFYLHFWGTGDAVTLARAIKSALDTQH